MNLLLYIKWNPNPELFRFLGIPVRYYGLLWLVGIVLAYLIVHYQFRDRKISEKTFEPIFFYCFFGILIGARLGHCFFYEPELFLTSWQGFVEMILPIDLLPGGGWRFIGYQGLASHGGTLGLMIALWLYCRKTKLHYIDVVDMIAVATPITACCIRLANLMNSEIVGRITDVPWAFVFERLAHQGYPNPLAPRHPAQLYEALAYLLLFGVMMLIYYKRHFSMPRGFYFGLCLASIFTFRFFVEFIKENQEAFENNMILNMGQWLSIPFILIGIYFMFFYGRKSTSPAKSS